MKRFWTLALPVLLTGCVGIPVPVTVANSIVNGINYLASGKSTTERVVSAALERDCAVLHIADGEPICQDAGDAVAARRASDAVVPSVATASAARDPVVLPPDVSHLASALGDAAVAGETESAAIAPTSFSSQMFFTPARREGSGEGISRKAAGDSRPTEPAAAPKARPAEAPAGEAGTARRAVEVERLGPAAGLRPSQTAAVTGPPPARNSELSGRPARPDGVFLVMGSFARRANAERAAARVPGETARLAPALIDGRRLYRVVVGPMDTDGMGSIRDRLRIAGLSGAWAIAACAPGKVRPGCLDAESLRR